jgi:uncharacterized protein with GYD domain
MSVAYAAGVQDGVGAQGLHWFRSQKDKRQKRERRRTMPSYVILMNLTEQGVKNIKEAPARIGSAAQALEAAGGKLLAFYTVMGAYDYVAVVEAPNDQVALAQLLALGMQGFVRTTTLRAFTVEELAGVLKQLP